MNLFSAFPIWFRLIVCACVATYVASKAAVDAMVGGGFPSAGRVALGQWLPIAVLGAVAMLIGHPQIAVGIVFSTAVASLSLAAGATVFLAPLESDPGRGRCWGMLVPAGLLAFLAGFRGEITRLDAVILAVQGLFVAMLWNDRQSAGAEATPVMPILQRHGLPLRVLQILLAVGLAGVGGWLAVRGVDRAAASSEIGSVGLLTATLLSPLLVLPIIGNGTEFAQRRQSSMAVSSQVGVALLNVFALLPLLVLIWYGQRFWISIAQAKSIVAHPTTSPVMSTGLIFPLAVWRVDVVVMIALGLFLLPVAIGRWSLSKLQGLGLMLGYAVYIALSLLLVAMREV